MTYVKRTFLLIIAAVCLLSSCTNKKQAEARKALAESFVNICNDKIQNTNYFELGQGYSGLCNLSFKDKIAETVKVYLLVDPKDKETEQLYIILNSSDDDFQKNLDEFKEKYPKSVYLEYVDYLNVAKKGQSWNEDEVTFWLEGLYPDFSLLPDFEKKYPESKYLEHLKILEIFYRDLGEGFDDSDYTEDNLIQDIKLFCEKYPESKYSAYLQERLRYYEIVNTLLESDCYFNSFKDYSYFDFSVGISECTSLINRCDEYLDNCSDDAKKSSFYENIEYWKDLIERALETWNEEYDKFLEKQADGIWSIAQYVDKYNEYTDEKYIRSTEISGIYSGLTANRNDATLRFLINNENSIDFMLYEDGTPVKGKSVYNDKYEISAKDDSGKEYYMIGKNSNDRVVMDSTSSYTMHKLLMSNRSVRLYIERTTSGYQATYTFTVDCTGYDRVFNRF